MAFQKANSSREYHSLEPSVNIEKPRRIPLERDRREGFQKLTHCLLLFWHTKGPPESPPQLPLFSLGLPAHSMFSLIIERPFGSLFSSLHCLFVTNGSLTSWSFVTTLDVSENLPQPGKERRYKIKFLLELVTRTFIITKEICLLLLGVEYAPIRL